MRAHEEIFCKAWRDGDSFRHPIRGKPCYENDYKNRISEMTLRRAGVRLIQAIGTFTCLSA